MMVRRRRRLMFMGVAGFLLGFIGIATFWMLQNPAEGRVYPGTPMEREKATEKPPIRFQGRYVSLETPPGYEQRRPPLQAGVLERAEFLGRNPFRQIEVGVYRGTLSDNSGVAFRRENPDLYREEAFQSPHAEGLVFIRTDEGFQGSAYLQRGELLVTLALTAYSSDVSAYREELEVLLESFRWQ